MKIKKKERTVRKTKRDVIGMDRIHVVILLTILL